MSKMKFWPYYRPKKNRVGLWIFDLNDYGPNFVFLCFLMIVIKSCHFIWQCFSAWAPRNIEVPLILYWFPQETSNYQYFEYLGSNKCSVKFQRYHDLIKVEKHCFSWHSPCRLFTLQLLPAPMFQQSVSLRHIIFVALFLKINVFYISCLSSLIIFSLINQIQSTFLTLFIFSPINIIQLRMPHYWNWAESIDFDLQYAPKIIWTLRPTEIGRG